MTLEEDIKALFETNISLIAIGLIFWVTNQSINGFIVNYADQISMGYLYLLLFAISDMLFRQIYSSMKNGIKNLINRSADLLNLIPKIEYFLTFSIAVGIITFLNILLYAPLSNFIQNYKYPWLIVLGMFTILYLIVMYYFYPRFYESLGIR